MRRPPVTAAPPAADPVAAEVNAHIRLQADRFELEPHTVLNVMCACGCMTEVATTVSAYDAAGGAVLAPGHPLRERSLVERVAGRVRLRRRGVAPG